MKQRQPEDENLVNFVKKYRPQPPEPAPNLEARIMAAVAASPQVKNLSNSLRYLWLIPPAIAASIFMGWRSYQLSSYPTAKNPAELATLEAYIENNWDGIVNEHGTEEW